MTIGMQVARQAGWLWWQEDPSLFALTIEQYPFLWFLLEAALELMPIGITCFHLWASFHLLMIETYLYSLSARQSYLMKFLCWRTTDLPCQTLKSYVLASNLGSWLRSSTFRGSHPCRCLWDTSPGRDLCWHQSTKRQALSLLWEFCDHLLTSWSLAWQVVNWNWFCKFHPFRTFRFWVQLLCPSSS